VAKLYHRLRGERVVPLGRRQLAQPA